MEVSSRFHQWHRIALPCLSRRIASHSEHHGIISYSLITPRFILNRMQQTRTFYLNSLQS